MPLIVAVVALAILKFFAVWKFAALSWAWVVGLAVLAFVWFEFIEPMLGLDKRKAHDENDRRRRARVDATFKKK